MEHFHNAFHSATGKNGKRSGKRQVSAHSKRKRFHPAEFHRDGKENTNEHCITPPDVAKITWSGFGQKWPAAYAFLKAFEMNAGDQQKMMLRVDKKGEDLDAVVKEWVDQHEQVWKPWLDAAKS